MKNTILRIISYLSFLEMEFQAKSEMTVAVCCQTPSQEFHCLSGIQKPAWFSKLRKRAELFVKLQGLPGRGETVILSVLHLHFSPA